MFRKRLMKRSIEYGDLRQRYAQSSARSDNALNVCRIVQRRELDAVFDTSQHLIGYENRFRELFAAMDHAMTNGMNVGNTTHFSESGFFTDGPTENHLHGRTRIPHRFGEALR